MCVIKYVPDWKQYWPMLACFENSVVGHSVPDGAAEKCAVAAGIDITEALACTKNVAEATALTQMTARKTCQLQPEHQFTPWVTLNGAVCGLDGTGCHGMLAKVCSMYKGSPLPAGCVNAN